MQRMPASLGGRLPAGRMTLKMLPPSPLPLDSPVLQLDPIALCCPGNELSEKKLKLSKAPRLPALPACLLVGRKGV